MPEARLKHNRPKDFVVFSHPVDVIPGAARLRLFKA